MEVRLVPDPRLFSEVAGEFSEADPFSTSVIGVHTSAVVAGLRPCGPEDLWAAVVDRGRVAGVAMHTPPFSLFVSRMAPAAASALARAVFGLARHVPGVTGEVVAASAFAGTWAVASGARRAVERNMRMYRLQKLRPPSVPGCAQLAGDNDIEVVTQWFAAFHAEAAPHRPGEDVVEVAKRRLAVGQLSIWVDDGKPVSLAGCSPPAGGVARVGPVYTPPLHRRHGYAAAVTAAVTRSAIDGGSPHVVLYTDLANPTSNSVYQSIGFVVDHDAQEWRFTGTGDKAGTVTA